MKEENPSLYEQIQSVSSHVDADTQMGMQLMNMTKQEVLDIGLYEFRKLIQREGTLEHTSRAKYEQMRHKALAAGDQFEVEHKEIMEEVKKSDKYLFQQFRDEEITLT